VRARKLGSISTENGEEPLVGSELNAPLDNAAENPNSGRLTSA
jgi:hypothetical protein